MKCTEYVENERSIGNRAFGLKEIKPAKTDASQDVMIASILRTNMAAKNALAARLAEFGLDSNTIDSIHYLNANSHSLGCNACQAP